MVKLAHNSIRSGIMTEKRLKFKHWLNDYIQDHTIKVDKLPLYGNDNLIYQLPNKLEYIYFEKKWECIGEVEELNNERKEECGMTEKRFKMKKLEYEAYFIDSQQEYVDEDEPNFKIDGEKTLSDSQILDLLNENEQLKQQLIEKERMLDVRDKIIKDVMKAVNGDVE